MLRLAEYAASFATKSRSRASRHEILIMFFILYILNVRHKNLIRRVAGMVGVGGRVGARIHESAGMYVKISCVFEFPWACIIGITMRI